MARKSKYPNIPACSEFFHSTLKALIALGGSGTNAEINQKVYELADISEEMSSVPHAGGKDGRSEIDYRLGWTRTYLSEYGLIHNSARGIWTLTDVSIDPENYDSNDIVKHYQSNRKNKRNTAEDIDHSEENDVEIVEHEGTEIKARKWKDILLHTLCEMSPDAFERLTQRILRESGFSKVEVTGKVGDGGIDGKGIVNLHGLLNFNVVFQCKRYKGSVSSGDIRNFRGAMQGRSDLGLFITTDSFTSGATKEATRDGAPPIDLIDGNELCEKLKALKLGINIELVEQVTVETSWFEKI